LYVPAAGPAQPADTAFGPTITQVTNLLAELGHLSQPELGHLTLGREG
jgi:hypothetical protein